MARATALTMPSLTPRAALVQTKAPVKTEVAKTHNGLSAAFSLHLIKSGQLSTGLGRALGRAHEIRLLADYTGDPVEPDVAAKLSSNRLPNSSKK
jgi:uncharacterized protein (UPF0332 family)